MSKDYDRFLKDAATQQPSNLRCAIHDGFTYPPGGSCYYCRTGYKPSDINKNGWLKESAKRRVAKLKNLPMPTAPTSRKNDPATSKAEDGVDRSEQFLMLAEMYEEAGSVGLTAYDIMVKGGFSQMSDFTNRIKQLRAAGWIKFIGRRQPAADRRPQNVHVFVLPKERDGLVHDSSVAPDILDEGEEL
jgi:hypothetical protein